MRAVRFDEYGGVDVLEVVEVTRPSPGPGQVLVQVKAAGINPGESKIRNGLMAARWLVEKDHLTAKPAGVSWEVAGALFVAGVTAYAAVRAVAPAEGDTVAVAGAAGGVGSIAVQLARRAGATVIGIASEANHDWLRGHGVIPVAYDEGVTDRIRAAAEKASGKVDAFIDTVGGDYVQLALDLGVAPSRIDTIVRMDIAQQFGVKTDGSMAGASANVLAELAGMIAAGELEVPIEATFPLSQVQDAYRRLEQGHLRGKIVLIP